MGDKFGVPRESMGRFPSIRRPSYVCSQIGMDHISFLDVILRATRKRDERYRVLMTASWASTPSARKVMQANRSRDTRPELRVRQLLHASGLRYRVAAKPLTEHRFTADLVFRRARVAVFIDGCFWHGCPAHHRLPMTNRSYWRRKVEINQARDRRVEALLSEAGWTVLRFWEHEDPATVAYQIQGAIASPTVVRTVTYGRTDASDQTSS